MIAAEYNNSVSTIRIHDEFCEPTIDHHISRISYLVSESYKRRQFNGENGEVAAMNRSQISQYNNQALQV